MVKGLHRNSISLNFHTSVRKNKSSMTVSDSFHRSNSIDIKSIGLNSRLS